MKTKFCVLVSFLLALGLLSLMTGCGQEEQSVTAPLESMDLGEPDAPAFEEQAEKATAAQKAWWRGLSQATRNQAIIERAWRDNGRYVGLNCKEWARVVVYDASRSVVNLPATMPNASGWYFAPSPYLRSLSGIRAAFPGCVVQTNWKLANGSITPHTLIVTSSGPSGIGVIECNWTPLTVTTRFISFTEFERQALRYTCYYVIGG